MKKNVKEHTLFRQAVVFSVSLLVGCIVYTLSIFYIVPQSLPVPKTSAINWLVLHKHSLTLDYIRFLLIVLLIPVTVLLGQYFFLWRKK